MTKKEKTVIEDVVWDRTVGTGRNHDEPNHSDLQYIEFRINRALNADDVKFVLNEWRRCLQSMAQP